MCERERIAERITSSAPSAPGALRRNVRVRRCRPPPSPRSSARTGESRRPAGAPPAATAPDRIRSRAGSRRCRAHSLPIRQRGASSVRSASATSVGGGDVRGAEEGQHQIDRPFAERFARGAARLPRRRQPSLRSVELAAAQRMAPAFLPGAGGSDFGTSTPSGSRARSPCAGSRSCPRRFPSAWRRGACARPERRGSNPCRRRSGSPCR